MSCDVLGCFHAPNVDPDIAKALNDNALVYDGRLVVNSCFQTNDPSVLAAGSLAKYSRRYGKQLPLEAYNAREVGAASQNSFPACARGFALVQMVCLCLCVRGRPAGEVWVRWLVGRVF